MNKKEVGIAYVLLIFFGALGIHKFYLNKAGIGIVYMFTGGIMGIGCLIDLFTLVGQVRKCNESISVNIVTSSSGWRPLQLNETPKEN